MKNIGFISFRIAGTDGVSLEIAKWAEVLQRMGHQCYYLAGELDRPDNVSMLVESMHFQYPEAKELYNRCFDQNVRPRDLTESIHKWREIYKQHIYDFVEKFQIDVLIPQNAVTIPLNIPLAMAITEYIAETNIPTIAHHHDFFWERKRFLTNCVWDYINSCYPPHLSSVAHVVINTSGQNQLALRTGISSTLIPNVMDFESDPPGIDDYNKDIRQALGIDEDELLILQPTRVVQRKGIEHAIEMVSRLQNRNCVFVISHASGDEGFEYENRVREFAELLKVRAIFVEELIQDRRKILPDGRKVYTLQDLYPHADFVTYPSLIEGFGNAFLETIWFRKPILVNNYSIYSHDIKPKGFEVVEIDDFITNDTIREVEYLLDNPDVVKKMTEKNYQLGLKYYSYTEVDQNLKTILGNFFGQRYYNDIRKS